MPPEEGPHELTFMQWPVSRRVYSDALFLGHVQDTIADIANTIAEFEPVVMLAAADVHASARQRLSSAVELWDIPTEDLWCRDSGPIFVANDAGDLAIAGIQFNGWGDKQVHRHDGQVSRRVAQRLGVPVRDAGLYGEGGGVEQDGHGLLMAHESSWVHDGRNPTLSRDEIEERLLDALGGDRMIWAPGVWDQDITDYHIDSLARFTGPGRVLMNLPRAPDPRDPFHIAARETHDVLLRAGLAVDIIHEPTTPRVQTYDFVASYVNYYVCNGAVITAQFGDAEADAQAIDTLKRAYPGREVITLNVDPLGELGGGIHCATQQMPAV
ncbi:MAG: agmatine deiminase family protein [Pseudomonadota bacterium]